jgi:hypothetical protein
VGRFLPLALLAVMGLGDVFLSKQVFNPWLQSLEPAMHVLKLPDLEQSKSAVLNSLTSRSSQRTYDHTIREFIEWYCSEPRLAFNKTVVTRYRI